MNTEFVSVIPILRIFDTVKAKGFYVSFRGLFLTMSFWRLHFLC